MRNNRSNLLFPGALLTLGLTFAGNATASLVDCASLTPDISGNVTPSVDCRILEPLGGNTKSSPSLINSEAFFGFSDWLFDGKLDDSGTALVPDSDDPATLVSATGNAQSGIWRLVDPAFWAANTDLMFIFKDGADTNLVGYRMQTGATGGSYTTPFVDPPFELSGNSTSRDISHIGIYFREGVPVPAPGVLALLGIGLLGLGWCVSRRRGAAHQ